MAQGIDVDKLKKGVLSDVLKEINKGKKMSPLEKVSEEAAAKAREGKGLLGGAIASQRAKMDVAREYQIATKGTMGKRQAFFEGLLGKDLGDLFKTLGLEKMESAERVKEAREKFGLDKKEKESRGGASIGKLAKPISLILRNVIQTQKMVRNIEKALTKPSLKSGYTFDPRMAGGGRYKDVRTNKIVSSKEATGATKQSERTAALTAAINADEEPLVKLREFLEIKFKNFDPKKMQRSMDNTILSLNGVTPTLGLLSVHDKLNMILAKSSLGGLGDMGRRGPKGRKPGGRGRGGFGKIGMGGLLAGAAGGFLAYQAVDSLRDENLVAQDPELLKQQAAAATTPEQKRMVGDQIAAQKKDIKLQAAATGAGAAGAVGTAVAVTKLGKTAVVKNAKSKAWNLFLGFVKKRAPKLFAKIGARLAVAGGLATVPVIGWVSAAVTVVGSLWMAYDLYQLWQEFSALSDAEKTLYDEKAETVKSTGEVKPNAAPKPSPVSVSPTSPALPGGAAVAAATTTAAAIPASVGANAAPTPPAAQPKTFVQTAVEKAKEIGSGVVSGAKQVASAVSNLFSGPAPKLEQVTTKQNAGVDTSGLQGGMQDRLARMAKAFQEVTGKKLMLTSAYRSDDKQMKLWTSKYNELKAANPNATEAQLVKMTRKWVALPMALGGKGSAHGSGAAVDINSKGAAGIEAINGMTFNGQMVNTDSFLSMFGLKRPLNHEPWHLQPLEGAPTPDNPDPNAKPLVADAKGNMVNLETGKAESIQTPPSSPVTAQAALPPVDTKVGGGEVAPSAPASQPLVASSNQATPSNAPAVMAAAPASTDLNVQPVPNTIGTQVAQQSSQLETSRMTAQTTSAPVVINNSAPAQQQPITPPKQPLPKASTRSSESAFNRAIAHDFAHPTSFTSAIVS